MGGFGTHSHSTKYTVLHSLDTNPLRSEGFTIEMFSVKINQKLYTHQVILHCLQANEVQIAPSPGCCHFVLKKVHQSHMQ